MNWQSSVALAGVVAAGANAGVFFAFSSFVMRGLGAVPDAAGTAAMQEINRYAPNPAFMLTLFGAALVGVPLAISPLGDTRWAVGAVAFSVATIVITATFHVPRNDALDALDPQATTTAAVWRNYLVVWTRGNHVRALTSAASAACYAAALRW